MPCPQGGLFVHIQQQLGVSSSLCYVALVRLVLSHFDPSIAESLRLEGNCCSSRGGLEQVVQDSVPSGFEIFTDRNSSSTLGNLFQCLIATTVKTCFCVLILNVTFLIFLF